MDLPLQPLLVSIASSDPVSSQYKSLARTSNTCQPGAMAEGIFFVCDTCLSEIQSWGDGNPYYLDELGLKRYAYHPDHEGLARCVGNDEPHLCLNCGAKFAIDSRVRRTDCPECHSTEISTTYELEGKDCPTCKRGVFARDASRWMIS